MSNKTRKDYAYILIAGGLSAVAGLILIKMMQHRFSQADFDIFILIARYAGTVVPLLVLGTAVATPRYIGYANKDIREEHSIINTSIITIVSTIAIYICIVSCLSKYISEFLFSSESKYLAYASIYFIAQSIYGFSYSILRGREQFLQCSSAEVFLRVVVPISLIYIYMEIEKYLISLSLIIFVTGVFIIIFSTNFTKFYIKKKVYIYGRDRVIGDIMFPLMLTIPVLYTAHWSGNTSAAKLSIIFMIMNVFLIPITPISTLILPKVGRVFLKSKNFKRNIIKTIFYAHMASVLMLVSYIILARFIWSYFSYTLDINYYIAALILYFNILYIILRSLLDGLFERAYIFRYLLFSLFLETALIHFLGKPNNISIVLYSMAASYIVLVSLISIKLISHNATYGIQNKIKQ